MKMGRDTEGFLRIRWPLATIIYGVLAGAIIFGYNQMRDVSKISANVAEMSANVQGLARGVSSLEKRMDMEAQNRYTVSDAGKDLALVSAQLAEHKRRMDRLEAGKK